MSEQTKTAQSNTKVAKAFFDDAQYANLKGKHDLSLETMLKAGVHFGHKKSRWNPKMRDYIFGTRNGIHIIDLEKTIVLFEKALEFIGEVVAKNGIILIVGTIKQAKNLVRSVADRAEMPYANERWLGGTFTNFGIIKKRVKYLIETNEALEKGKLTNMTKLERHKIKKKLDKIDGKMGGLVRMARLPDAVIILDINKDELALKEARSAGIKVVGLVDSNSDPTKVDYPVPANDDALSSLKYVLGVFLKRILEAKNKQVASSIASTASKAEKNV
ncbi:MAG: 30S ribosomal protein S2 [Patescibacteria group bacterium]|nr:30S ribosomal protein S2 [Patescibacteria group bacterium]